jgi:hypothetical protein
LGRLGAERLGLRSARDERAEREVERDEGGDVARATSAYGKPTNGKDRRTAWYKTNIESTWVRLQSFYRVMSNNTWQGGDFGTSPDCKKNKNDPSTPVKNTGSPA